MQERLKAAPEWDLVVCDEAHRMSGHVFGDEIKLTAAQFERLSKAFLADIQTKFL